MEGVLLEEYWPGRLYERAGTGSMMKDGMEGK